MNDILFHPDGPALLYGANANRHWSRTYRISAVLDRDIDPATLQKALDDTYIRFPVFSAVPKGGLTELNYIKGNTVPVAEEEKDYPHRPLSVTGKNACSFRVLYYKNKISLEVFHGICDGGSACVFLYSLIGRYVELSGEKTGYNYFVRNTAEKATAAEIADGYRNIKNDGERMAQPLPDKLYRYLKPTEKDKAYLTHFISSADDVKKAAKRHNLSITEFFTAALIYSFIRAEKTPLNDSIFISVPVNLRHLFPDETLRNFVYAVLVEFNPEGRQNVAFDEICDKIRGEVKRQFTREKMQAIVNDNVASQDAAAKIPLVIKKAVLHTRYKKNQCSYTTVYSNLGVIDLPDGVKNHITGAEVTAGATPWADFSVASVTVNGVFTLTMASASPDFPVQDCFEKLMGDDGLEMKRECNADTDEKRRDSTIPYPGY